MSTVEAFDAGIINYGTFLWAIRNEAEGYVKYIWTAPVRTDTAELVRWRE